MQWIILYYTYFHVIYISCESEYNYCHNQQFSGSVFVEYFTQCIFQLHSVNYWTVQMLNSSTAKHQHINQPVSFSFTCWTHLALFKIKKVHLAPPGAFLGQKLPPPPQWNLQFVLVFGCHHDLKSYASGTHCYWQHLQGQTGQEWGSRQRETPSSSRLGVGYWVDIPIPLNTALWRNQYTQIHNCMGYLGLWLGQQLSQTNGNRGRFNRSHGP